MKIVITGGNGMLGRTLQKVLGQRNEIRIADINHGKDQVGVDITNPSTFDYWVRQVAPDIIIHCAAMTNVDKCESEQDLAYKLNVLGTMNVANTCRKNNIRLIAISTDYVFDGMSHKPYSEFDLPTGGLNVYGRTKWLGEQMVRQFCPNHVICRISWLYGEGGPSFVHTMVKLGKANKELNVVENQVGNPTSCLAVARALQNFIYNSSLVGTYHLTCEGEANWYQFAKEIFKQLNMDVNVRPCSDREYIRPAQRPANSRLEKMMLRLNGLPPMPDWKDALAEFLQTEKFE